MADTQSTRQHLESAAKGEGGLFDSQTQPDIIKGWNDRRQSNNQVITGLVPFVQLIGVFNPEEYKKMFSVDTSLDKRKVYYVGEGQEYTKHLGSEGDEVNLTEWIERELKDRFINLYLYSGREPTETNSNQIGVAAVNGIIMAEKQSQVKDFSGGIGITDLQVDYGKTNGMGSRKFVVRMTVNDATSLNTKPEYAKLSTMQGEFVILYGWSHPQSVPGFDATPPPIIEPDHFDPENKKMMMIPLGNMNTGGYWAAARLRIIDYDFSFNEMGQLEIAITFMDLSSMYLASTRIASIAQQWRKIMSLSDHDPAATRLGTKESAVNDITNLTVTNSDGSAIPIKDAINEEQNALKRGLSTLAAAAPFQKAISLADGVLNETLADSLGSLASYMPYSDAADQANMLTRWTNKKQGETRGFPDAVGLSTYEKVDRLVSTTSADEDGTTNDDTDSAETVEDYRVRVSYYYLGWILEGMKLSLRDVNKGRALEGEEKFVPRFLYLDNEPDSNLSSAFQSSVPKTNRKSSYEEEIQGALIRLKEKCFPPFEGATIAGNTNHPPDYYDNGMITNKVAPTDRNSRVVAPFSGEPKSHNRSSWSLGDQKESVCKGRPLVNGMWKTTGGTTLMAPWANRQRAVDALFPVPIPILESGLVDLPHRGHVITISTESGNRADYWKDALKNVGIDEALGDFDVFIPDWYVTETEEVVERVVQARWGAQQGSMDRSRFISVRTGGSPNGFDPTNPTAYKAKDRRGRFFYGVEITWTRESSGQTGRVTTRSFWEIDEFRSRSEEFWQQTQGTWHNRYLDYLSNYFEFVIRRRVAEVEASGKPLTSIYNEPIDLDFLTSKVYNNSSFMKTRKKMGPRFKLPSFDSNKARPISEGLISLVTAESTIISGIQEEIAAIEKMKDELREKNQTYASQINHAKSRIEILCGGKYQKLDPAYDEDTNSVVSLPQYVDPLGNRILMGFQQWKGVFRGEWIGDQRTGPAGYDKVVEYEDTATTSGPVATQEWFIWKNWGIPTDNFRDHGTRGNEQLKWIDNNEFLYQQGVLPVLKVNNKEIGVHLATVERLEGLLNDPYLKMQDLNKQQNELSSQIERVETRLTNLTQYFDSQKNEKELGLYDDTSAFDDEIEWPMGREFPMVLKTKVAQQWASRFGDAIQYGVVDVGNYGPPRRGQKYYRPSNRYHIEHPGHIASDNVLQGPILDASNVGKEISGSPRVVLDPVEMQNIIDLAESNNFPIPNMNLSKWLPSTKKIGNTEVYFGWHIFGNPLIPYKEYENGKANSAGYIRGPAIINEDGTRSGGNYVTDYEEFLKVLGITYNPNFLADVAGVDGDWPNPFGKYEISLLGGSLLSGSGLGQVGSTFSQEIVAQYQNLIRGYTDKKFFYMIDDDLNIIMEVTNDQADTTLKFVTTGFSIKSGTRGDEVYLYPSRSTATKIDPITRRVLERGNADGNDDTDRNRHGHNPSVNQSSPSRWKIGTGQHCMNFTLDMKRSLVHRRGPLNESEQDSTGQGALKQSFLGIDDPAAAGVGTMAPDYDLLEKRNDGYYYVKSTGKLATYESEEDGKPKGSIIAPMKLKTTRYTNEYYPWGTGNYIKAKQEYGSFSAPEGPPRRGTEDNKNWLLIGDFLELLPGRGFFTTINNDNYSPSMITANGTISDAAKLNVGFVDFVIRNVLAPLPKNRRIGARLDTGNQVGSAKVDVIGSVDYEDRMVDVCYGHLFRDVPIDVDETQPAARDISTADLSELVIDNVADIPIRRDVVDNIINKNNTNMSMAQAIMEMIRPEAIGINTGNINVGIRQRGDGVFEVFQASKNWRASAKRMIESFEQSIFNDRYPTDHLLFDYKSKDSLIQNIDMSSKFDPAIAMTFRRGAEAFAGDEVALAQFLSYGNVANELKEFLSQEPDAHLYGYKKEGAESPNGFRENPVITVRTEADTGAGGAVEIDRAAFFGKSGENGINKVVPTSVVARFLMNNPERMAKLNALIQARPGNNFATQLLAQYMRTTTITINGTTNIAPFSTIHIRGILPNLEGIYLVTNTRESITPQNFETIIEAVLLEPIGTLTPEERAANIMKENEDDPAGSRTWRT